MTRIKQTDILPPSLTVQAEAWHRGRGDGRTRVARVYRVEQTPDGSGAEEYVLTRYENRLHVAMSSLLRVEGEGWGLSFKEICRESRGKEGDMIVQWYEDNGVIKDGTV